MKRSRLIALTLCAGIVGACGRDALEPTLDAEVADALADQGVLPDTASDRTPDSVEVPAADLAAPSPFKITTPSPLPEAKDGVPYEVFFQTTGGQMPIGWLIKDGNVPRDLILQAAGTLSGVPSEIGTFSFTLKAIDDAIPPRIATQTFELTVKTAPLVVTGDTAYDLWVTKIIVLPMIVVLESIPIPYQTQLTAKGGLKPYHWAEIDLPSALQILIPTSGVPDGLVLDDDGRLHGAVTDSSQVIEIVIPGSALTLRGFLFAARVSDSQVPARTALGIYLIPTIPVQ